MNICFPSRDAVSCLLGCTHTRTILTMSVSLHSFQNLPSHLQDTLRNPTVRHFMDNSLEDSNFTTTDILNFLYTGPEEWRAPGMPSFDWRNVFSVADQLLRTFSQYGEVRNIPAVPRRNRPTSAFQTFPGCSAGSLCWGLLLALQTGAWLFQVCSLEGATRPLSETEQTT